MDEPNPVVIFDTLNAFQRTGALKAAIDLKVFTLIGQQSLDAAAIASAAGANQRGIRILCDYLTVLEFLQKDADRYSLTPTSAAFLDEQSPRYMGSVARFVASNEIMDMFRDVVGAVRNGGTLQPDGGSTKVDYELWIEFAKTMAPMMRPAAEFMADLVARRFPTGNLRVLDVAAGHGLFGISIARRLEDAEIVALDFDAVLQVAHQNARDAGIADRYQLLPGDARSIEFDGSFDCVLLTNFLHHFGTDACKALLDKVRSCLNPGGIVLTLEFVPNEDRVSPATPAAFALTMLLTTDCGDAYTFADYQRMFTAAGFSQNELIDVPASPSRLVISEIG